MRRQSKKKTSFTVTKKSYQVKVMCIDHLGSIHNKLPKFSILDNYILQTYSIKFNPFT